MKKRILIILVLVLVWVMLFVGTAFVVIHREHKEVAKVQEEKLLENENIENIDIGNESTENNTSLETTNEITEENKNNEQTNESVVVANVENTVSKDTTAKPTTKAKTNTQVQTKENNSQNNKKTETNNKPQTTTKTEPEQNVQVETKTEQPKPTEKTEKEKIEDKLNCVGGKHYMDVGNSNKWFNTEQEAINLYNTLQKEWSDKLTSGKTTDAEYDQNCPCRI